MTRKNPPNPRKDAAVLAAQWAKRHPELGSRLIRAVQLVNKVTPCDYSPGNYFVEGTGDRYLVRVFQEQHTSTCTCPDSERGNRCKHRLAVALYEMSNSQLSLF